MGIKDDMPQFARHEGVWEGTYRHYDSVGQLADEHRSRLVCRFPEDGPFAFVQTIAFSWPDGRTEIRDIPAIYRDGRLWWESDQFRGWASELPMDDAGRTLVLYWRMEKDPDLYIYEMVQLSDCGKKRSRTWQWIRNGEIERRTAIDEKLVSRNWQAADPSRRKAA